MTQLSDRIEGEIKTHEAKMLEKIHAKREEERLKKANELMDSFERAIDQGVEGGPVSSFDSRRAARACAILSLNNEISRLGELMEKVTNENADKTINNEIDSIILLVKTLESIVLPGT